MVEGLEQFERSFQRLTGLLGGCDLPCRVNGFKRLTDFVEQPFPGVKLLNGLALFRFGLEAVPPSL